MNHYLCLCYICRKRAAAVVEIYKEYFARMPGYPIANNQGGIDMAVYCLIPGVGVLENDKLLSALNDASTDIQTALGNIFEFRLNTLMLNTKSNTKCQLILSR